MGTFLQKWSTYDAANVAKCVILKYVLASFGKDCAPHNISKMV